MQKTNAIRILEAKKIPHTIHSYKVDEKDLSGVAVAKKLEVNNELVFKTLVATGDKTGINVFCIPVIYELNLNKAAVASNNKKIEMVKVKELFHLTGYIRGGCSPLGMKKHYPIFIEETAQLFDKIYISAGVRGLQIFISPIDLKETTGASFVELI